MGKGGIPDRWRDYCNIGRVIKGTRFIALKVPLNAELLKLVPPEEKWGVSDVINVQHLGHVIDLTYTNRYYKGQALEREGVKHTKIKTPGRQVPTANIIQRFYAEVDQYFQEEPEKLVGVHCTHGLNRSGYLICRYMIEKLGHEPNDAINEFNEARGHEQERENLIEHLKTLKRGVISDVKSNPRMDIDNNIAQSLSSEMDRISIGNTSEEFTFDEQIDSEEMQLRESKKLNVIVFGLQALNAVEESVQIDEILTNIFETIGFKLRPVEDFEIIRSDWKNCDQMPWVIKFTNHGNRDCILRNSNKIKNNEKYKNVNFYPELTKRQLRDEAEMKKEVEKRNKLMKESNPEEAKHYVWKLIGMKGQRRLKKVHRRVRKEPRKRKNHIENAEKQKSKE